MARPPRIARTSIHHLFPSRSPDLQNRVLLLQWHAVGGGGRHRSAVRTARRGCKDGARGRLPKKQLCADLPGARSVATSSYRGATKQHLRFRRIRRAAGVSRPRSPLGLSFEPGCRVPLRGLQLLRRDDDTEGRIDLVAHDGSRLQVLLGRSFKAPTLQQQYSLLSIYLEPAATLGASGLPASATVLYSQGGNRNLKPERATTFTTGLVYHTPQRSPACTWS